MKKMFFTLLFAICYLYASAQVIKKIFNDKKLSIISYSINHPLHAWTGVSNDITSVILSDDNITHINQVAVSVKISTFDSQNANRDSHLVEVAEALRYPAVTFVSNKIVEGGTKLTVTGNLTFHGTTQPITFEANRTDSKENTIVIGSFIIKMSKFKIDPPSLMGVATEDDIKIDFKVAYIKGK